MTKSDRWFSSPTQVFWTCMALMEGRTISHRTEIHEVKGWRLAAVCHRLRRDDGWPIVCELRGPESVAHYRLAPGTDLTRLRFPPSAQGLSQDEGAA